MSVSCPPLRYSPHPYVSGESTRLVLEYKNKLQLSDAEQTRLNGSVDRLKGQVARYKTQMDEMASPPWREAKSIAICRRNERTNYSRRKGANRER